MRCICPFVWSTLHWTTVTMAQVGTTNLILRYVCVYVWIVNRSAFWWSTHKIKEVDKQCTWKYNKRFQRNPHTHTSWEEPKKCWTQTFWAFYEEKPLDCVHGKWKYPMRVGNDFIISLLFFFRMHPKSGHADKSKYSRKSVNGCRISEWDKFIAVLYRKNIKDTWIELIKRRVPSDK